MPLQSAAMKAKFKKRIEASLARNFPEVGATAEYGGVSKEMWSRIADAISDVAMDIVDEIQTNAEVTPGIPVATAGSPAAHTGITTAPGKIK
jgi:hypothetical protein